MNVLVVGGGGREHAIAHALSCNSSVSLYSVMGQRNPGIDKLSKKVLIRKETDVGAVVKFAEHEKIDYAVIGPEAPLEAGIVDALLTSGILSFGPTKTAARLETNKEFCRMMMSEHEIAGCPMYRVFHDTKSAEEFIKSHDENFAIKPIGLTGGKGVKIMGEHLDKKEAVSYIGNLKGQVVIEELLVGEEFTLQAFVDGSTLIPMPLVQDHKRAFEGDTGPNTGGMGSYSMPDHLLPFVNDSERRTAFAIMKDTMHAFEEMGEPYRGVLYGQFMNTKKGPMLIEFNARFGDPEAMNVLTLLSSDFFEIIEAVCQGDLKPGKVSFSNEATVCKYLVPEGYPENPKTGDELIIRDNEKAILYYANIEERENRFYTMSSRTLAFVGRGKTLEEAHEVAEKAALDVKGKVRYRHDIGTQCLIDRRLKHMRELNNV